MALAARFYKTRGAATEAVLGGRVQVNGARVKPSKEVKPSDLVDIQVGMVRFTVVVSGLADKRGPASVAATLYDETDESRKLREQRALERRLWSRSERTSARARRSRIAAAWRRCDTRSGAS